MYCYDANLVFQIDSTLVTCTDKGTLTFWPEEAEKVPTPSFLNPLVCCVLLQVEIHQDKPVACMRANTECHLQVATGGKENDLKLWDGSKPEKPTFQAKNVSLNCYLKKFKMSLFIIMVALLFVLHISSN